MCASDHATSILLMLQKHTQKVSDHHVPALLVFMHLLLFSNIIIVDTATVIIVIIIIVIICHYCYYCKAAHFAICHERLDFMRFRAQWLHLNIW